MSLLQGNKHVQLYRYNILTWRYSREIALTSPCPHELLGLCPAMLLNRLASLPEIACGTSPESVHAKAVGSAAQTQKLRTM